jgi:hypothetical protein
VVALVSRCEKHGLVERQAGRSDGCDPIIAYRQHPAAGMMIDFIKR